MKNKTISKKLIAAILCIACLLLCQSCSSKNVQKTENANEAGKKAFMKIAPDEISSLEEFDILYSDKYFIQIKITYLYGDMRMKISRDKDKYDIFSETSKTYTHNIVKDGTDYKLYDEKKTYSASKAKDDVNVSFFELNGNFVYKGVTEKDFNGDNAYHYRFAVKDSKEKSELVFVVKDKKLKGLLITSAGAETKLTIEAISKDPPESAFEIPNDYKKVEEK